MRDDLKALGSTSMAHFSNDGVFLLFSALIVYYSQSPELLSVLVLGYFASIYTLVSGVLSLPVGKWSDSGDRDPELLFAGILLLGFAIAVFSIPFYFGSTMPILIRYAFVGIGAVVMGFGQAFYHPIGADILRYMLKGKDSSFFLGINGSFGSIGRSAIFFIVGILIIHFGTFQGLFLLSLYYFVISVVIYVSSRNMRKNGRDSRSRKKSPSGPLAKISSFKGVIPFLTVLTSTMFLRSAFQLAVATYMFKYIDDIYQNGFLSYLFLFLSLLTPVVGQPYIGHLTAKIGGNKTLLITGTMSLASFIVFLLFSQTYLIALPFFALYAFSAFTGFPSLLGFINQKIPKELATRANTWVWGIGSSVGGAVGIMIYTSMTEVFHLSQTDSFWIMLSFLFISIITNLMISPYSQRLKSQITAA